MPSVGFYFLAAIMILIVVMLSVPSDGRDFGLAATTALQTMND